MGDVSKTKEHPGMRSAVLSSAVTALKGVGRSSRGRVRKDNQDAYAIIQSQHYMVCAVADGMGQSKGGALAARTSLRALESSLQDYQTIDERVLSSCIEAANREILEQGAHNSSLRGMGTTLVVLGFCGSELFLANIGDSRAYRLRGTALVPLTQDHTVVFELVRSGLLTPEQAHKNPMSHLLTRALGSSDLVELDCWRSPEGPVENDRYLLCSDGLHNCVSDDEIRDLLMHGSPSQSAKSLIERANSRGGKDNITAVIVDVGVGYPASEESQAFVHGSRQSLIPPSKHAFREGIVIRSASLDRHTTSAVNTEDRNTNSTQLWKKFGMALVMLLFGFFTGALIFSSQQSPMVSTESTSVDAVPSAAVFSGVAPDVTDEGTFLEGQLTEELSAAAIDDVQNVVKPIDDLVAQYQRRPNSVAAQHEITQQLLTIRDELDLLTRKLALWYQRQAQLARNGPLTIVEEVAISSEVVRAQRREFQRAHEAYLQAAEQLVYNPLSAETDRKVSELSKASNREQSELAQVVEKEVQDSLADTIRSLIAASIKRDRLQAVLEGSENSQQ